MHTYRHTIHNNAFKNVLWLKCATTFTARKGHKMASLICRDNKAYASLRRGAALREWGCWGDERQTEGCLTGERRRGRAVVVIWTPSSAAHDAVFLKSKRPVLTMWTQRALTHKHARSSSFTNIRTNPGEGRCRGRRAEIKKLMDGKEEDIHMRQGVMDDSVNNYSLDE